MKILRPLFFLLLTINVGLAALNYDSFSSEPGGEPERLASQLHPEKLSLGGRNLNPEPAASAPGAAAEAAPVTDPAVGVACVRLTGVSRPLADDIETRAKELQLKIQRENVSAPSAWWVHLPAQSDRAAADRKAVELQRLGVNDYFVVNDAGANQNAISLGLYKSQDAAKRALEQLRAKGVQSARITERDASSVKVEISGRTEAVNSLSGEFNARMGNALRSDCVAAR